MKKEIKTNVMRILEKEKVPYLAHEYPHGKEAVDGVTVASLLGQDPACVFKTLVTKGAGGAYYVFVVPVTCELDLKKCARSVGEKSVEMIPVKDITKVTGYVRGGCSPLGMKKPFAETLRRLRVARHLSQEQLAIQCNVSRQTINAIEKGDYNPTINLCIAICKVLDKTLDELFWEQ